MALSQKQIIIGAAVLLGAVLLLRGCTRDEPVQVYTQPQTQHQVEVERQYIQQDNPNVVVVQPPQTVDTGINAGHLAAGALGYMAGKSSNSHSYSNRPVINKNYYSKKVYVNKSPKKYTYKTYKRK